MIINEIPEDLFEEKFRHSIHLFSDDSLFIHGFITTDNALQAWSYDVMKNEQSIFKPDKYVKEMLIKTFESKVPTPTSAHFVNDEVIILLFDSDDGIALLMTIKLNLTDKRISLVDSLFINDVKYPFLLKDESNFGIAFTHVEYKEKGNYDRFAAYYSIKQENGHFLPLGDRIISTSKYYFIFLDIQDPHLYDNKLWYFRVLPTQIPGPFECLRVEKDDVHKMQLYYFDLNETHPKEIKFAVIENMPNIIWLKKFLFMLDGDAESVCSIFDLTNKTLVHLKDANMILKFRTDADKLFIFGCGNRIIDFNSNVTMIDIRKKQLLHVPLHENSTKMDEAEWLMNKELVRIVTSNELD